MSDDPCFSNSDVWERVHPLDRPFPCRRRGITRDGVRIPQGHYASCSDDECRGCVPRQSVHGSLLCDVCTGSLMDALSRAAALIVHLRSVNRTGQALGERVNTSMERSILIPNSWSAADQIMDALGAAPIPSTADIDDTARLAALTVEEWGANVNQWVNTREGAKRALVLMRRMRVALRQFPDSEAQYRHIPHLRCGTCREENLWRQGPEFYGDDCLVVCSTPGCTYQRDWWEFAAVYGPILETIQQNIARAEKQQKRGAA